MPRLAEPLYTAEEYLALERSADHKSELVNGRIYAMTGASMPHNQIVLNVSAELRARLRGGPCRVFANDMRVKVARTGMYTYPDVVALCEPPRLEDSHLDTLLNPAVIIEVLSPSTHAYDRGEKFAHYRTIESLREYILIAQDHTRIERYVRRGEQWVLHEVTDPAGVLPIETLGCEIPVGEIYDRVEFLAAGPVRWPRSAQ
jgi:Uma2 family endonuclease